MEYEVVVWLDDLSDGSTCYAAVCPAIAHAHGQGDTEEEALAEAADTMAVFLEKMPGRVKTGQTAQDEMAALVAELTAESITHWFRQVAPCRTTVPA